MRVASRVQRRWGAQVTDRKRPPTRTAAAVCLPSAPRRGSETPDARPAGWNCWWIAGNGGERSRCSRGMAAANGRWGPRSGTTAPA
eukprot:1691803-Rhodomonas_salina.1